MTLNLNDLFLYAFFTSIVIQLIYTIVLHARLAFFKETTSEKNNEEKPVSVVIAARNESDNLFKNLPQILEQSYKEFEVIVVNNQSTDDSNWLLMALCRQYKHLRVIEIRKNRHLKHGKKLPLSLGIKGAKYQHILLTDADCKPSSPHWIKQMTKHFKHKNHVILGYGPHEKTSTLLNKLLRFDTVWIAINYFSFCLAKIPYMGVGRNLAYTKSAFNSVHGFRSHYSIVSGDDDLFIQEVAKTSSFSIELNKNAHCQSSSAETWGAWVRQKTRHHSTSKKYNVFKKWLLGIYPFTHLLVLITFVYLCITGYKLIITAGVFMFILALKWIVQGRCLLKLGEKSFVPFIPIWDVLYAILMPVLFLFTFRKQTQKW